MIKHFIRERINRINPKIFECPICKCSIITWIDLKPEPTQYCPECWIREGKKVEMTKYNSR
ncbi:MAG: Zn-finger protein [Lokiarchaeia virus VerdaV1]|uniref:Zn-finger protein n=1 Tax=Lokiarchaeia virus VerdaV1 TaxID=3070170 RepID=A0AA35G7B1_9CAUD|nr:MAG: Zn-finger protein [Lokiarchaeia virus VerdaV1]BDI54886.1 MAG: Zn-finger protein [Lokiarchaeia virus VerdaV1]